MRFYLSSEAFLHINENFRSPILKFVHTFGRGNGAVVLADYRSCHCVIAVSFKKIWHITRQQASQAQGQVEIVIEQWMEKSSHTIIVDCVHTHKLRIPLGGAWTWGKWSL